MTADRERTHNCTLSKEAAKDFKDAEGWNPNEAIDRARHDLGRLEEVLQKETRRQRAAVHDSEISVSPKSSTDTAQTNADVLFVHTVPNVSRVRAGVPSSNDMIPEAETYERVDCHGSVSGPGSNRGSTARENSSAQGEDTSSRSDLSHASDTRKAWRPTACPVLHVTVIVALLIEATTGFTQEMIESQQPQGILLADLSASRPSPSPADSAERKQ